jgi:hypothetical protein
MNEMVGEDRTVARVTFGASAILRFSGKMADPNPEITIANVATVTGRLYAIAEVQPGFVQARIRPRNGSNYVACTATGDVADRLSACFSKSVRAHGKGTWRRSEVGGWTCSSLEITAIRTVDDVPLREAIDALRKIKADWTDDPLGEWEALQYRDGAA